MINTALLKSRIEASTLPVDFIAYCLGIPSAAYLSKQDGIREFMAGEIKIMRELLRLTDDQTRVIFFE